MFIESVILINGLTIADLLRRLHNRTYLPVYNKLPKLKQSSSLNLSVEDFVYRYEIKDTPIIKHDGNQYSAVLLNTYKLSSDWLSNVIGMLFVLEWNPFAVLFLNREGEEEKFYRTIRSQRLQKLPIDFSQASFDQAGAIISILPANELKVFFQDRSIQRPVEPDHNYKVLRTFFTKKQPIYLNLRPNPGAQRFICQAISPNLQYVRTKPYAIGIHCAILGVSAFGYAINR